jgi:tRNA threonylcarbamoyladenosine biosynthesis protein TsaE
MPILDADTLEFISRNPDQTRRIGARLGALLKGGDVVALEGELGSGKTVLAQGIGQGWGVTETLISPTFVLIRRYERLHDDLLFYHIDLYRLIPGVEVAGLGLDELLGAPEAVCVLEWPDRATALLPEERLCIGLRWLDEYRRSLTFRARGDRYKTLLNHFRQELLGV